jgi:hypothetical protein
MRAFLLVALLLGACRTFSARTERPPGIPPDDADTAKTAVTPHEEFVGPVRDIPPSAIVR